MSQCNFIKPDGQRCQAKALKGQKYCLFHSKDPKTVKKRLKANSKGGLVSLGTGSPSVQYFELKTISQVLSLLEFVVNSFLQGKMPKSKASCLGYLSNILIGAIRENNFEERLEVIENALGLSKKD